MFIKSSSKINFKSTVLNSGVLFIFLLTLFWQASAAEEKPNFLEPFKKCWNYGADNGLARIIASDNESNLILSTDNYSLASINPETNLENWKSATGGRLELEAASDEAALFFLTSFEDTNKEKTFTLNSISLKTGLTNWQQKFPSKKSVRIIHLKNKETLFLIAEDRTILAVSKEKGETLWAKDYRSPIVTVESSNGDFLKILTSEGLFRSSAADGRVFEETNFKQNVISNSVVKDTYLLIGYKNGEIAKITTGDDKIDILWKIKAGASISGLIEYQENVLVTSLDNFIYLFSHESGKLKWKKRVAGRINIKPIVFDNFAVVFNSGDSSATFIDLRDGKAVNQIRLEPDNHFSGPPSISGRYIVFQTYKGISFFVNTSVNCK